MSRPTALLSLLLAALGVSGCVFSPARAIPDPLPETLAWAAEEAPEEGAFLGLDARENDSGSLESLSFDPGVRVHAVADGSPAAAAGIRAGDVVLGFDGEELAAPQDLEALLAAREEGDEVELEVQRGDTVFGVDVVLGATGAIESAEPRFHLDPARSVAAWGDGDGAALLVARDPEGPVGHLAVGARVVALDGDPIRSGRGLVRRLLERDPGTVVALDVVDPAGLASEERVTLLGTGRKLTRFSIPVLATYDASADGSRVDMVVLDLWIISLFRYTRQGGEKSWRVLRFFQVSSGVGELES